MHARLAALLVVGGLLLAGCNTAAPADTSSATAPPAEQSSEAPEQVTVEHAMGTTEVDCTPERVVTLGQGQTDTVLALGVTPVGVVNPWTDEWYDYLPDEVGTATVVGSELEPDLEAIAALQPDVILGSKLRHEAFYAQLAAIAPTVFSETIGVAWKDNVSLWAQALCRAEKGEEVLTAWEERTSAFAEALGEKASTEVSMIRFMPDQVRIYLTGFPGSVLRDAGLTRPAAQVVEDWDASPQLVEISEERIPEMDGDVIFVMVSGEWYGAKTGDVGEVMERWKSTELWKNLGAVKAGQVFEVNEDHWNLGGGLLAANAMLDDLEERFLDS
jgi:iron complex transport system substrate-binding protein